MHVDGTVLPCCLYDDKLLPDKHINVPLIENGIEAAFDSALFNNVRNRMEKGEKIPECHKCWHAEETTGVSLRTQSIEDFGEFVGNSKIRSIETALSTHCNLSCRMCNETFSSKWKLINNPNQSVDTSISNFDIKNYDADLSDLIFVKLVGGEPMIDKNHSAFLETLFAKSKNPNNVSLYYNTNGTIKPNQNILNFWKEVKQVIVVFSIDGIGDVNEILRPPHKWSVIDNTIKYFKSCDDINFDFRVHTVISAANIKHLLPVINYTLETFGVMPEFDLLHDPDHLSLKNLNKAYKNEIEQVVNNKYTKFPVLTKYILDFINCDSDYNFDKTAIIEKEQRLSHILKTSNIDNLL